MVAIHLSTCHPFASQYAGGRRGSSALIEFRGGRVDFGQSRAYHDDRPDVPADVSEFRPEVDNHDHRRDSR